MSDIDEFTAWGRRRNRFLDDWRRRERKLRFAYFMAGFGAGGAVACWIFRWLIWVYL